LTSGAFGMGTAARPGPLNEMARRAVETAIKDKRTGDPQIETIILA
jgi:hypothetical protein